MYDTDLFLEVMLQTLYFQASIFQLKTCKDTLFIIPASIKGAGEIHEAGKRNRQFWNELNKTCLCLHLTFGGQYRKDTGQEPSLLEWILFWFHKHHHLIVLQDRRGIVLQNYTQTASPPPLSLAVFCSMPCTRGLENTTVHLTIMISDRKLQQLLVMSVSFHLAFKKPRCHNGDETSSSMKLASSRLFYHFQLVNLSRYSLLFSTAYPHGIFPC